MTRGLLAVNYATALLGHAREKGVDVELYGRMKTLAATFAQGPLLRRALEDPRWEAEGKIRLLLEILGPLEAVEAEVLEAFFRLVYARRREDLLQSMALQYVERFRKQEGFHHGRVVTAAPLPPDRLDRIRERMEAVLQAPLELEEAVDPALLGGFTVEVDMCEVDASVRTQLDTIRKSLLNS